MKSAPLSFGSITGSLVAGLLVLLPVSVTYAEYGSYLTPNGIMRRLGWGWSAGYHAPRNPHCPSSCDVGYAPAMVLPPMKVLPAESLPVPAKPASVVVRPSLVPATPSTSPAFPYHTAIAPGPAGQQAVMRRLPAVDDRDRHSHPLRSYDLWSAP